MGIWSWVGIGVAIWVVVSVCVAFVVGRAVQNASDADRFHRRTIAAFADRIRPGSDRDRDESVDGPNPAA